MSQTESLCLSIMKSISVWKLNTPSSVSMRRSHRIWWLRNFLSLWNDELAAAILRSGPGNQLMFASSKWHLRKWRGKKKKRNAESSQIYILDESFSMQRWVQRCHVLRNVNGEGGLLGGGAWPVLNHNDGHPARPLKGSERDSPLLLIFQWFLLSNTTRSSSGLPENNGSWAAAAFAVISKYLPVKQI